jgi:hypothetical protein
MAGSEDGEVGAVHAAKVATAAFLSSYDVWRVVTLGVESGGKRQHAGGAKLYTKATPLAALDGDEDGALGHYGSMCTSDAAGDTPV